MWRRHCCGAREHGVLDISWMWFVKALLCYCFKICRSLSFCNRFFLLFSKLKDDSAKFVAVVAATMWRTNFIMTLLSSVICQSQAKAASVISPNNKLLAAFAKIAGFRINGQLPAIYISLSEAASRRLSFAGNASAPESITHFDEILISLIGIFSTTYLPDQQLFSETKIRKW